MLTPAKFVRVVRNVWLMRSDLGVWLAGRYLKRKQDGNPPIAIRCNRCGHELTKPCKPGSPCHVFTWPDSAGEAKVNGGTVRPGMLVYVRRQKPRGGQLRPDYEMRLRPF